MNKIELNMSCRIFSTLAQLESRTKRKEYSNKEYSKTGSLARDEDAKRVECGFKIAVHNEYLFHPTCNLDFATVLCVLIKLTTN